MGNKIVSGGFPSDIVKARKAVKLNIPDVDFSEIKREVAAAKVSAEEAKAGTAANAKAIKDNVLTDEEQTQFIKNLDIAIGNKVIKIEGEQVKLKEDLGNHLQQNVKDFNAVADNFNTQEESMTSMETEGVVKKY